MNKWTLKSLVVAAAGVLALAGQARAAVSYTYTTDLGPNGTATLNVGESKTLKLYLRETLTAGSTSVLTPDKGLFSGSMRITRSAGSSANLGTATLNAGTTADFKGPTNLVSGPGEVRFQEAIGTDDTQGVQLGNTGGTNGTPANGLANSVYLGTVVVTGVSPGLSTFTTLRYDPTRIGNTFTYQNFYDMDADNANPAFTGTTNAANIASEAFTVNVVPEPTSAGVAVILSAAGTLIRRRRQQA